MEISSVLNNPYSMYVKSSNTTSQVGETTETKELSDAEKLEAFKKEIWNEIDSMSWNSSMNISIQITDGAFKRMMNDSEFKDKMLKVIREESIAAQPPGDTSLTWIDENGYKGYSYIDIEAGHAAFKSHSTDKDSFYTKKATKKIDYEELWEEQRLKKEQENERLNKKYYEERLDNDYYDSLIEKRTYYQQQSVASLYEKGTVVAE